MQEVTYTNLAGESVTFGADLPLILVSVDGTEGTAIQRKTLRASLVGGERTVSALLQDREIGVTFNLFAKNREHLYEWRAKLSGILGAEKGFNPLTAERGKLTYRNDYGQWWTWAIPGRRPLWPKRIQDVYPNVKQISFVCDSPYWFSMWESSQSFEGTAEGFRFPYRFPVRFGMRVQDAVLFNKGQAVAPLRLTLGGKGEKITLMNQTTGAALRLVEPFPQGATLHISTDPDDLYVRSERDGVMENAYGYLDVTTPISNFVLAPGRNIITYSAGTTVGRTAVEFRWRDRFEGV